MDAPSLSAEAIFSYYLKKTRLEIILSQDVLSEDEEKALLSLIMRRARGEPLAYIVGEKEFFGLNFKVNPYTLIPRPETETIIEVMLELFSIEQPFFFVDCGAGAGNICITLVKNFPLCQGIAIDLSSHALEVLEENISLHGVEDRLFIVQGDLLSPFKEGSVDVVVSNPPYLSPLYLENIQKEVVNFEPSIALFGGEEGHEIPAEVIKGAFRILKDGGYLIMEMDQNQLLHLDDIIPSFTQWKDISIYKDLTDRERVLLLKKYVR